MRKILSIIIISALLFAGVTSTFFSYQDQNNSVEQIELLLKVDDELSAKQIAVENQIEFVSYSTYGFAVYQTVDQTQVDALIDKGFIFNNTSKIVAPPWQQPGDPLLGDQYAIELMGVDLAWTFTEGSADITIAIIDTGIDTDHDEFTGRLSSVSYNSRTDEVGLAYVEDDNGHGTAIAGVIGANKDNSKGIAGLVQNSTLLIIKANNLDDPGTELDESKRFSDAAIIAGIHYAVDQGADIINLSLGGTYANPLTEDAIERARNNDVIVVAASGNDGTNEKLYPASFEGVISVGAVDETSTIWSAEDGGSNYNDQVDITAPGVSIITTGLNNQYLTSTGTSLAAPQVTGIIGLMLAYFDDGFSSNQIISQLLNSAIDHGDPGYDIYYGYGIVNAYQALQVEEVTITFETYDGTTIDPITLLVNQTFEVDDPIKTGHSFQGWYYDESFEFVFEIGVDTTNVNLTLYAKYQPNTYDITFVTDGTDVETIQVLYGDTFEIPLTELNGYDFQGWYYDIEHQNPYQDEPIVNHLTLYAKFTKTLYTITYYVDSEVDSWIEVAYGDTFNPPILEGDFTFLGWYMDPNFIEPYVIEPVIEHLNLYARFDDGLYTVVFFDSDLTTVIQQNNVYYGSEVDAPTSPTKASTPSFDYIFETWTKTYDYIEEDTFIYPVFSKVYKPESIYLLPGIDTVYENESWNDGEIFIIDELLSYEVRGEVNIDLAGRYTIFYDIYEGETIIDTKVRMVRVVEREPKIIITLNPDVTTIERGKNYKDPGATSNLGDVTSSGEVNSNEAGIYVITYEVAYGSQIATIVKYVYVIDQNIPLFNQTAYIKKEQEVWFL